MMLCFQELLYELLLFYFTDIDILNGLKWSNQLDEVFRENYEADNDILWQYFGSQTGFMRTFPGILR